MAVACCLSAVYRVGRFLASLALVSAILVSALSTVNASGQVLATQTREAHVTFLVALLSEVPQLASTASVCAQKACAPTTSADVPQRLHLTIPHLAIPHLVIKQGALLTCISSNC